MAWIRTPFFFLFDFSFILMPLTIEKERCRAKAKAKAKAKAIQTSFLWLRCVLWCGYLFLSFIVKLAFSFPSFGQWQLIRTGSNSCCVPVLVSGNKVRAGSSDEPRSRPWTDAIYLAPDSDLGPDPSPGSAYSLQIRVLCEPEEAKL
jgi:hypothetical protein